MLWWKFILLRGTTVTIDPHKSLVHLYERCRNWWSTCMVEGRTLLPLLYDCISEICDILFTLLILNVKNLLIGISIWFSLKVSSRSALEKYYLTKSHCRFWLDQPYRICTVRIHIVDKCMPSLALTWLELAAIVVMTLNPQFSLVWWWLIFSCHM